VRNLFLLVLFLNLAYFAWSHWVDVARPPVVNQAVARLPRLKLVAEAPADGSGSGTRMALNDSRTCLSVGPFGDIGNAAKAAGILRSKGFDPRQRAIEGRASEGFWVYIGGLKSDLETDRARVSLERSGFKDALVMPASPETGRRISLGLFSDKAHAEQRAAAVKKLGLKAEIAERKLPGTVYWIDLAPLPGMITVPLEGLFAEGVDSRIAVEPCPAGAAPGSAAPPESPPPLKQAQAPTNPPLADTVRATTKLP
jgi:hypothetical protein